MSTSPTTTDALRASLHERMVDLRRRYDRERLARVEDFLRLLTGERSLEIASPLQRPTLYYFPGLTNQAWHDDPPHWMPRLEAARESIREELDALMTARTEFTPYVHGSDAAYRAEKFQLRELSKDWTVYDLLDPAAVSRCPRTTGLIDELFRPQFGEPVTAQFSALRPGARIAPHCGVANFFLTTHLGLVHSEGCQIRVGDEARGWPEGKGIVFDDSFEHEVWHDGSDVRIVFLARFWHPDLTDEEIESVGALHECVIDAVGTGEGPQREALARLRSGVGRRD